MIFSTYFSVDGSLESRSGDYGRFDDHILAVDHKQAAEDGGAE